MKHPRIPFNRAALDVGDCVIIRKSIADMVRHFGVCVGLDRYGNHLIAENHWRFGVRIVTLDTFLDGEHPHAVEPFQGNYWKRQQVVARVNERVGRTYNVALYNCEHFANDVRYGRVESQQVRIAVGVLLAILFLVFVLPKLVKRAR